MGQLTYLNIFPRAIVNRVWYACTNATCYMYSIFDTFGKPYFRHEDEVNHNKPLFVMMYYDICETIKNSCSQFVKLTNTLSF